MRDIQPYPRFFSGEPAKDLPERWQWTFPIVFDPFDANTLYISSQHVWKTTNDGQSWTKISPDLTRADPATLGDSGGPITRDMNGPEVFATVFAYFVRRRLLDRWRLVYDVDKDPHLHGNASDDGLLAHAMKN